MFLLEGNANGYQMFSAGKCVLCQNMTRKKEYMSYNTVSKSLLYFLIVGGALMCVETGDLIVPVTGEIFCISLFCEYAQKCPRRMWDIPT